MVSESKMESGDEENIIEAESQWLLGKKTAPKVIKMCMTEAMGESRKVRMLFGW